MSVCCLDFWLSSTVSVWVHVFLYVVHCNVPWGLCQHVVSGLGESRCSEWRMCKGGGCGRLGLIERVLLNSIGEVPSSKPIANCVFDLVNKKNLSGGMIGPGSCQWFHKWCSG